MTEEDIRTNWGAFYAGRVRRRSLLTAGYIDYVVERNSRGLPPIFEMHHLSLMMNIKPSSVANMINNIDLHYRSFEIPKKTGAKRAIDAPLPILLCAQRWIYEKILLSIKIGDHCHSYKLGKSIVTNAAPHLGANTILKMDLHNFFSTISKTRVTLFFLDLGYQKSVSEILSTICCKGGCLPQGAPTSPALSNIIAKEMDDFLADAASRLNLTYTRYADDLTFSGEKILPNFVMLVTDLIQRCGFEINRQKTQLICGNRKKIVTGVSVGGKRLRLPRETRRELEKQAYYIDRFGLMNHCLNVKRLDPIYIDRLYGKIMHWLDVEPDDLVAKRCCHIVERALDSLI